MKVVESEDKSLLDSNCQILVHQVNCQGVMGAGIAKTIRDKYPIVYNEYVKFCSNFEKKYDLLGQIAMVRVSNKQAVCNLFGQYTYGHGKRYTKYDAVVNGFESLRDFCVEKGVKSIAVPVNMGCTLAGGNWTIYKTIILETFKNTDIEIEFCKYDRGR